MAPATLGLLASRIDVAEIALRALSGRSSSKSRDGRASTYKA